MSWTDAIAPAVTALTFMGGAALWIAKAGGRLNGIDGKLSGIEREVGRVADGLDRLVGIKEEHTERIVRLEERVDETTRRLDRMKAP